MGASGTDPRPGETGTSGEKPGVAGPTLLARSGELWVAGIVAAVVAGVLIWWAWKQGAYFESVFLPGAIVFYGLLILLLFGAPFHGRLRGPALVALAAMLALAAWTLLSIAWTPAPTAAVRDFEQAMLFAALFALGLWTANLAGQRMLLALGVVAAVGTAVGVVTTVTLAAGTDVTSFFHDDATLRFPIGYRNAEAAFFLICLWPLAVLACEHSLPWQLRAPIVGAMTMVLELVVLSQSRGSLPAAAVALAVFVLLSPRRLRAAAYLALAALPVAPALPALLDVFQHGGYDPGLVPLMRDAARAIVITSLASVAIAAICMGAVEPRLNLGRDRVRLISRVVAGVAIVAVAVGGTVFIAKRGGPIDFVDQRVEEFKYAGEPNLQAQGTRFGVHAGSNRRDFWRVALDQGGDDPLNGGGAGSFAVVYLQDRDSPETPNDPHSVEMLMWSELGAVGVLLLASFVVASVLAGLRTRRLGPAAAALVAGSLTSGAYWLVHSSYDWLWHYPAVTAPVMFLLGAAAAPALRGAAANLGRVRYAAMAPFALALLIAIPLFLSQRYANRAYDEYPGDPGAALSDLDRAIDLDPYDPQPLLGKGVIESRLGRRDQALESFREAIDRMPEGYAGHYFLARELTGADPAAARAEVQEALRLNPLDPQVRRLAVRLQRSG